MRSQQPANFLSERNAARDLLTWGLLATAGLMIALAAPALYGRSSLRDDLGAFHLPARAFYAEQLARGEPFDWMPQLFCGFYLTGEGQAGAYHPLHWLLYRWLPLPAAASCEWLLPYPLIFAGTFLFLRRRLAISSGPFVAFRSAKAANLRGENGDNAERAERPVLGRSDAAAFGGLAFAFSGFNLLHFIHPNAVAVIAHLPWLLWMTDVALCDARRTRVVLAQAGVALLTASQLLTGYPQYVWFSMFAEAAFVCLTLYERRRSPTDRLCEVGRPLLADKTARSGRPTSGDTCIATSRPSWSGLAVGKLLGILLGGLQLLPTLDALAHSARRGADPSFAAWGSLHPANLIQLVSPYFYRGRVFGENTHELSVYLGAVTLVLAVWAVAHWRRLGRLRPLAFVALALAVVALLLALGGYGPLHRLQSSLPLVRSFRFPCRHVVLIQFAAAVLAAIGLAVAAVQRHKARSASRHVPPALRPLGWLLAVALLVAGCGLACQGRPSIAGPLAVLVGPALIATAAALLWAATRGSYAALVGLVLLAAADLGVYGLSYAVYPPSPAMDEYLAAVACPPAAAENGGLSRFLWPGTTRSVVGTRMGLSPSALQSEDRVLCDLAPFDQPGLRNGNEMLLRGWSRADGYAGLEPQRTRDFRNLAALQVAGVRWVRRGPETQQIAGLTPRDEDWLEVPDPLPRVRLTAKPAAEPQTYTAPGWARLMADRPGRIEVALQSAGPQTLVIAESHHPGWQVAVDGRPRPLLCAEGGFLGCAMGPDDRTVVFTFRPQSLRRGWFNTLLGLGLLGGWMLAALGRPARRRPPPTDAANACRKESKR